MCSPITPFPERAAHGVADSAIPRNGDISRHPGQRPRCSIGTAAVDDLAQTSPPPFCWVGIRLAETPLTACRRAGAALPVDLARLDEFNTLPLHDISQTTGKSPTP